MIKAEHMEVWGFSHAIRGMRNPMNSWAKSDSSPGQDGRFQIGPNDMDLMRRLYRGGTEHRKYLRQIFVSMDITAPLYWWKEFDTYKIGTVANSTSTMHKIAAKEFEMSDFSTEHLRSEEEMQQILSWLNRYRDAYLKTKDKADWWAMIQLLPESYHQTRTVTMNYENVLNIIRQRTHHKLDEWNQYVALLWELPYLREITER
ncbi:MAG: hypothetical protein LIV24_06910 [Eubacterium sp.]|nr:hypothetical protein [Eubacterium sp.]